MKVDKGFLAFWALLELNENKKFNSKIFVHLLPIKNKKKKKIKFTNWRVTFRKRISVLTRRAAANWVVINDNAVCAQTTSARAWVNAFLI